MFMFFFLILYKEKTGNKSDSMKTLGSKPQGLLRMILFLEIYLPMLNVFVLRPVRVIKWREKMRKF